MSMSQFRNTITDFFVWSGLCCVWLGDTASVSIIQLVWPRDNYAIKQSREFHKANKLPNRIWALYLSILSNSLCILNYLILVTKIIIGGFFKFRFR